MCLLSLNKDLHIRYNGISQNDVPFLVRLTFKLPLFDSLLTKQMCQTVPTEKQEPASGSDGFCVSVQFNGESVRTSGPFINWQNRIIIIMLLCFDRCNDLADLIKCARFAMVLKKSAIMHQRQPLKPWLPCHFLCLCQYQRCRMGHILYSIVLFFSHMFVCQPVPF